MAVQLQTHESLSKIAVYFTIINSTNEQTTQTDYCNRNTIALPDKDTVKREWKLFKDMIEAANPHIRGIRICDSRR